MKAKTKKNEKRPVKMLKLAKNTVKDLAIPSRKAGKVRGGGSGAQLRTLMANCSVSC